MCGSRVYKIGECINRYITLIYGKDKNTYKQC